MRGCCLDLQCSEVASPIFGGRAGGFFSDLVAAYSLQPPSSVERLLSLLFSITSSSSNVNIIFVLLELVCGLKLLRACLQWTSPYLLSTQKIKNNNCERDDRFNMYPASACRCRCGYKSQPTGSSCIFMCFGEWKQFMYMYQLRAAVSS